MDVGPFRLVAEGARSYQVPQLIEWFRLFHHFLVRKKSCLDGLFLFFYHQE